MQACRYKHATTHAHASKPMHACRCTQCQCLHADAHANASMLMQACRGACKCMHAERAWWCACKASMQGCGRTHVDTHLLIRSKCKHDDARAQINACQCYLMRKQTCLCTHTGPHANARMLTHPFEHEHVVAKVPMHAYECDASR